MNWSRAIFHVLLNDYNQVLAFTKKLGLRSAHIVVYAQHKFWSTLSTQYGLRLARIVGYA